MTGGGRGGILSAKSTKGFTENFRKSLTARMSEKGATESLQLLYALRGELLNELTTGQRIPEELGKLIDGMSGLCTAEEFKAVTESFSRLAIELFDSRPSVSSACAIAGSFYEKLLQAAFAVAIDLLEHEGEIIPDTAWALLVSGEMGREESVLAERSSFFLVYRDSQAVSKEYFCKLSRIVMVILSKSFRFTSWQGSASEWLEASTAAFQGIEMENILGCTLMTYPVMVEIAADLRVLCGDHDFAGLVIESTESQLADSRRSEFFWHFVKDVASMPVALGIFGRFKTARSGKNRGKFNLNRFALDPLNAAAMVLSISLGGRKRCFSDRIKSILASGSIGVALADRLLTAYQDFKREAIRLELKMEEGDAGFFFDPDHLDAESKERFKTGLEDITTLQRLVYQQLVESEPA